MLLASQETAATVLLAGVRINCMPAHSFKSVVYNFLSASRERNLGWVQWMVNIRKLPDNVKVHEIEILLPRKRHLVYDVRRESWRTFFLILQLQAKLNFVQTGSKYQHLSKGKNASLPSLWMFPLSFWCHCPPSGLSLPCFPSDD